MRNNERKETGAKVDASVEPGTTGWAPGLGPDAVPASMKAVVAYAYGEADVLQHVDLDVPKPAAGEVLVKIHAAGLHRGLWHLMAGLPYLVRLGFGFRRPKQAIQGDECSGTVVAVGDGVSGFEVGDEVFGLVKGAFAEYGVADSSNLAKKPSSMTFVDAAALPISAAAALQAVRDEGAVKPGNEVLILGASGAVGGYAVQMAKYLGAHVTGVCSAAKAEFVRSLGADDVIDYAKTPIDDIDREFDVVIDIGGNRSTKLLRSVLTPDGTIIFVGGEEGGSWIGGIQRQIGASLMSMFTRHKMKMFIANPHGEDFAELAELVESGAIRVPVDQTFPLERAPDGMRYLTDGRIKGKAVVTMD